MKRQPMAFKVTRAQLAKRDVIAALLRQKAEKLNRAIAAFNEVIQPVCRAVTQAQDDYNQILQMARTLTEAVVDAAQGEFDAKSEKWQDGEKGTRIRNWIEQWEMSLDDVDLGLPEPLEEIDPDEHAGEIEDAPGSPDELEYTRF